jgi:hypothetical protein
VFEFTPKISTAKLGLLLLEEYRMYYFLGVGPLRRVVTRRDAMDTPINENALFSTMSSFKNKPLFVPHHWPITALAW